jgi:hypothetical protein
MLAADRRLVEHVTPRLLGDVLEAGAADERDPAGRMAADLYKLMLDTVRMAKVVEWARCPKAFHSLARLRRVHDELAPRMEVAKLKRMFDLPDRFNEPPFEGTADIVPLMTPEEVCREGVQQGNCVGVHAIAVVEGQEFVYRVERPVRATLSVVRNGGRWVAGQLYLARNNPVDDNVRREVFNQLFAMPGMGVRAT